MRYTCRSDESVLNTSAHVFPIFFSSFFFFLSFFLGGGGGGLNLRSYCRKFVRLPYQENMHFLCLRGNYTKKLRDRFSPNLVQWCIIPKNRFEENLAFVTSKMRIQEFFFPLHTADAYANVPNCDAVTCTLF